MTDRVSTWVIAAIVGVSGLLALLMAAHATDGAALWFGLSGFVAALTFEFWLMKRSFDAADRGS